MQFKVLDKIIFEIKKVIFLIAAFVIFLAFSLLIYWVLLNMHLKLPLFFESFLQNVIAFVAQFYNKTSFYQMSIDMQPVLISVLFGIIAYFLNCLSDVVDMLYDDFKKHKRQELANLEQKINFELRKDFLSQVSTYNLMLIKIKINVESFSTYLTQHLDSDVNINDIENNILTQILSGISATNIVQKGKGLGCIYFLISDLDESKMFFSKIVDITTTTVKKALQPRIKITFLCAADVLVDIKEFEQKDFVTTKILDYNIPNKIVVTPAVKVYYDTLYKECYNFSILGEYNLCNTDKDNVTTLYSITSK